MEVLGAGFYKAGVGGDVPAPLVCRLGPGIAFLGLSSPDAPGEGSLNNRWLFPHTPDSGSLRSGCSRAVLLRPPPWGIDSLSPTLGPGPLFSQDTSYMGSRPHFYLFTSLKAHLQ